MTCRDFKAQVADWESNRLSAVRSERMADHRCRCADCAGEAQAETEMRGLWRAAPTTPPGPSVWPQIAQRLGTTPASVSRPGLPFRAPRWAFAGAVGLAALAIGGLWLGPKGSPVVSGAPMNFHAAQPSVPEALPVRTATASWSALPDVSRVDPSVDDPAGASTENVLVLVGAHQEGVR